ncbi:MAG TPA: MlaD family protein [Desulfovibrio sp.]|uniref:MlaD family protein n=1 Tax=Desulfovibrio sp. TaxID=885 RepID=UPI002D4D87DE|nr:MlaD family protein [Desulfovibrio sp.]HZF62421.1 MlaD family protein [Desulfovibrio sp.]
MNSQSYKTTVGAFVLGGLALLVLGIMLLGGGRLFSNDLEYVMYFDGSVSGLSTGAPVVFRGVPMGSVTRINLVANARDSNVTIPVYIRIDERSFVRASGNAAPSESFQQEIIRRMVQRGLRGRLQLQSLITGQYRVELDFYPATAANFRSATPDMEIPTIPSPIDTLQSTLSQMPLEQMVNSFSAVLQNLALGLSEDKLGKALTAFTNTFQEAHGILHEGSMRTNTEQVLKSLSTASASVEKELPATLVSFREAMQSMAVAADQLRVVTASAQGILGRDSPTMNDLRRLLKESTDTMRSMRALAEMLERNPEALLRGKQGTR